MPGILLPLVFAGFFGSVASAKDAPGAPGAGSKWTTASKDFFGTSASAASKVYFTGADGIVTEVFYPTLDCVQNVTLQFVVVDAEKKFGLKDALESAQKKHDVSLADKRAMLWLADTTADNGKWRISKKVFTDPARDSLVVRVTFQASDPGKKVRDFNVFVLNDPAINNSGGGEGGRQSDDSHTVKSGKRTMLVASEKNSTASALAISLPWRTVGSETMLTSGFAEKSDGLMDLFSGSGEGTMRWNYDSAHDGNIVQMGWVDFGNSSETSISFDVVLGLGKNKDEAIGAANGTLDSDLLEMERTYVKQWNAYTAHLNDQGGTADDQYFLAAMTLKCVQDKTTGAMIAGAGIPWGDTSGDSNQGGYHEVWARDLFKFASALLAAGDKDSANRAVDFLFNLQMQQVDRDGEHYSRAGRFPQNSHVSGAPMWNGTQMDEAGMPIILAWKLNRTDLWPKIKMAADFLAANGPRTEQDRWEELGGYSPSTIAAEVAGLVCAASLADACNDPASASRYRQKADEWRNNVANWTFTNTGPHGNGKYYIRIDAKPKPDTDTKIMLGNGAGLQDQRSILDGGFLELVRMGVMSARDWTILETLPEYDAILKQTIPGKGDAWFRYNFDGYGEDNDGRNYKETGRGRLWPIFTAERGIYEIVASGKAAAGEPYLSALKKFSTPSGFIPEQVWNISADISGWKTLTPECYMPGTATRSMCPLSWAMGEYINLLAAIHSGHGDAPAAVVQRYSSDKPQVTVTFNLKATSKPGESVYLVGDNPLLGAWIPSSGIQLSSKDRADWTVTISLPAATTFHYSYVKSADSNHPVWESGAKRILRTPVEGAATRNDRFE